MSTIYCVGEVGVSITYDEIVLGPNIFLLMSGQLSETTRAR